MCNGTSFLPALTTSGAPSLIRAAGERTQTRFWEFFVSPQANAYAMICRRAFAAGIATKIGDRSFRATGITAYLNVGTLEKAASMANHASTRRTKLYDRRRDEVERVVI